MKYLAKSNSNLSVFEHEEEVLKEFNLFLLNYGKYFSLDEKKLISLAIQYHDHGKLNLAFQKALTNKRVFQIPHAYLSVLFLSFEQFKKEYHQELLSTKELKDKFNLVLTAIYYHHIRKDYSNEEIMDFARANISSEFKEELHYENLSRIYNHESNKIMSKTSTWLDLVVVLGMLNRLDWASSANLEVEINYNENLEERIKDYFLKQGFKFNALQDYVVANQDSNLIVVGTTGSGKTEAALRWCSDSKAFFTLPLKISTNAIYERIHDHYLSNVSILHGSVKSIYEISDLDYSSAKMLSYPLTILTIDQLFSFVYKAQGTEYLLATLKYSKVIIDELQAYSASMLASIIYGLNLISQVGGKYMILTATLPKFVLKDLKETKFKYQKFTCDERRRHVIKIHDNDLLFELEKIKEDAKSKKVLVICNTVKQAQKIYEELDIDNKLLLHSRFIKKDRDLIEKEVIRFSKSNKNGVVISTQIIEVSLDIDFDVLYTYLSSIDSLIQRMGRVYRKRTYLASDANVHIYKSRSGIGTVYDLEIYKLSLDSLKKYDNQELSEKTKQELVDEVYSLESIKETEYYQTYCRKLAYLKALLPYSKNKENARKEFRDIDNVMLIPNKVYLEIKDKINELSYQELLDYCFNFNLYKAKSKYSFIKEQIKPGTNIYLASENTKYDFDYKDIKGTGFKF